MDLNAPDCKELLERFSRSVVRIHIYRLELNEENFEMEWEPLINIPGIVTVASNTFCHIIACSRKLFHPGPFQYRHQVIFPDETSVDFDVNTVEDAGWLASFYVPTLGKKVDAVQFNGQNAAWRDKVWVFGYGYHSESLLDGGTVTHIGEGKFCHDVPPNSYTPYGYPVFSLDKKLVGISYYDYGVTRALDVKQMTNLLSEMTAGMEDKPLLEILERIKVIGEAKYREIQD